MYTEPRWDRTAHRIMGQGSDVQEGHTRASEVARSGDEGFETVMPAGHASVGSLAKNDHLTLWGSSALSSSQTRTGFSVVQDVAPGQLIRDSK
ncbi:hypothetical protein NDU88_003298 [Pleurodeles waltl]|uniref:Uncharacterized protein n=1 Tax=Pleurodeles waltl TaxID=8319 RepID=A0AAV7WP13_PLEWA|nr:hypothetical protein NDU88_003298 [Pleurodeles waltl]